jgi:perosamine synthetase
MTARRLSIWPGLPLGVYLRRRRSRRLPFPLEEAGCRIFSRGRQALWHGVRAVGLRPGDVVLAPAYHHGAEIEALARAGLVPRFYEATASLEPDEQELDALLSADIRALHLTHYFGFPQNVDRWRRWCDERGLLLLEDAAQAWLATVEGVPVGSHGDVSIFCLYKTFGLPDGGAVVVRGTVPTGTGRQRLGVGPIARRHAAWLAGRSGTAFALADRLRAPTGEWSDEEFALGELDAGPSTAVRFLLRRLVDENVARVRRANYQLLLDKLGTQVLGPFAELPAGASPFSFPLETERKAEVVTELFDHGIAAADWWSIPHSSLPAERYPRASALRERVIGLPVHQELTQRDVERVAAAAQGRGSPAWFRSHRHADVSGGENG